MSSLRKQIRKNVINLLKGRTNARNHVRENRGEPTWQENLPSISVYFRGEPVISEFSQAPRELDRRIEMEIEILATGADGEQISDNLDDLAEQVERCLSVDDSLGNCADDIILKSVSEIEVETGGTRPFGRVGLDYEVKYKTFNPRDRKGQGSFDTLTSIDAEWDIQPGQATADRAKDTITPLP